MIDAEVLNAEQFSFASKPICLDYGLNTIPTPKIVGMLCQTWRKLNMLIHFDNRFWDTLNQQQYKEDFVLLFFTFDFCKCAYCEFDDSKTLQTGSLIIGDSIVIGYENWHLWLAQSFTSKKVASPLCKIHDCIKGITTCTQEHFDKMLSVNTVCLHMIAFFFFLSITFHISSQLFWKGCTYIYYLIKMLFSSTYCSVSTVQVLVETLIT